MSNLDDFLSMVLPSQIRAEKAIHNGDPAPRLEMWSTNDPVTLFGAWGPCKERIGRGDPYLQLGRVTILQLQ
jgi:hypothetical protein